MDLVLSKLIGVFEFTEIYRKRIEMEANGKRQDE